jgi:phage gp36-like protein
MSSYATTDDLTLLGLPAKAVASMSADSVDAVLEAASRTADTYLTSRYKLPLLEWDGSLKQAVASIAAFNLMRVRGFAPGVADAETLRIGYDNAMDWLRNVSKGVATLSGVTNVDSSSPVAGETESPGVLSGSNMFVQTNTSNRRGW